MRRSRRRASVTASARIAAHRQRAPIERQRRHAHRLAQQRGRRDRRGRGREREQQRQQTRRPAHQHQQDAEQACRRDGAGRERPPPPQGQCVIVGRATHRHHVQPVGRRAVGRDRNTHDRPHRVQRRAAHLVGEHAFAGQLRTGEHVPEVRGGDVPPPDRRDSPREVLGRRPQDRVRQPPAVSGRDRDAHVVDARAISHRAHGRDQAVRLGGPERERMPRDEVAHGVGDIRVQAARVRRRYRRRLPGDAFDGQRLARVERPPRARADAQHAFARIVREHAAAQRSRQRRDAGGRHVDPHQRTPQLDGEMLLQARDDRQVVDRRIVVEADRDQRLAVIAGQLEAHSRVGPRLHENAPHLFGIVGDPAGLVAFQRDAREQIGDGPGVRDAGLIAQPVREAADLAQDHRLVQFATHADEEHRRRAPLPRAHAQRRQQHRAAHRRNDREQPHEAPRTGRRRARVAPRPERERDQPGRQRREPARDPHAGDGHERERRGGAGRGRERRSQAPPAVQRREGARTPQRHQREERPRRREPDGQPPPAHARVGQDRPRLQPARRRRRQAQPRGRQGGDHARRHARPAVGVDVEANAAAILGQEPSERVRAPHDPLASGLALALARFPRGGLGSAPAPRQHRARAGVAARVGGDVEEARWSVDRADARHLGDALLRQRERLPVGGGERVVHFDRHLVERQQPEPAGGDAPAFDDLGADRRPRERIVRRARDGGRRERTECGAQGRKSPPAPGRHAGDVTTRAAAHPRFARERLAMKVAACATATLRSACASVRMSDSISIWYSRRRCVFSR